MNNITFIILITLEIWNVVQPVTQSYKYIILDLNCLFFVLIICLYFLNSASYKMC